MRKLGGAWGYAPTNFSSLAKNYAIQVVQCLMNHCIPATKDLRTLSWLH